MKTIVFLLFFNIGVCQCVGKDMKVKNDIKNEGVIYDLQCIMNLYKKDKNGQYVITSSKTIGDSNKDDIESIIQNLHINSIDWCIIYIYKKTTPELVRKIINILKKAKLNIKILRVPTKSKSSINKKRIVRCDPTKGLFYKEEGSSKWIKADPIPPFLPSGKMIFQCKDGKVIIDKTKKD